MIPVDLSSCSRPGLISRCGRRGAVAVLLISAAPPLASAMVPPQPVFREITETESPDDSCGVWRWTPHAPESTWTLADPTCIPREYWPDGLSCPSNFRRAVVSGMVAEASAELSNSWLAEYVGTLLPGAVDCGAVDTSLPVSRYGVLSYRPSAQGTGVPQMMQFECCGTVNIEIKLHRSAVIDGSSSASASGAARAQLLLTGMAPSRKFRDLIASKGNALAYHPGASWATQAATSSLGVGVSVGASNGGNVNWTTSQGGDEASLLVMNRQAAKDIDCVAPPAVPADFIFDNGADLSVLNSITGGKYSKTKAWVTYQTFAWRVKPGCISCLPNNGAPALPRPLKTKEDGDVRSASFLFDEPETP